MMTNVFNEESFTDIMSHGLSNYTEWDDIGDIPDLVEEYSPNSMDSKRKRNIKLEEAGENSLEIPISMAIEYDGCVVSNSIDIEPNYVPSPLITKIAMTPFPDDKILDFKHVIYNELVANHNNESSLVQPCHVIDNVVLRHGFRFNEKEDPEEKLPELYCGHIKKARLDLEVKTAVFVKDLYKYYLRSCLELLSKYFEKVDKFTYLYDENWPLFEANGSLDEAQRRIRNMKTRARRATPTARRKVAVRRSLQA